MTYLEKAEQEHQNDLKDYLKSAKGINLNFMTEEEKARMIELLIEGWGEAADSEGIFFLSDQKALELLEKLKRYGSKPEERARQFDFLYKLNQKRGNKDSKAALD